jgi:hypothetical protein
MDISLRAKNRLQRWYKNAGIICCCPNR